MVETGKSLKDFIINSGRNLSRKSKKKDFKIEDKEVTELKLNNLTILFAKKYQKKQNVEAKKKKIAKEKNKKQFIFDVIDRNKLHEEEAIL